MFNFYDHIIHECLGELHYLCNDQLKSVLSGLDEFKKLMEEIRQGEFKSLDHEQSQQFINLISKHCDNYDSESKANSEFPAHFLVQASMAELNKRLGEINLDIAKALVRFEGAEAYEKIDYLERYLGNGMFSLIDERCESNVYVILEFVNQVILSVIPVAKKAEFDKMEFKQSEISEEEREYREKLSNDRQRDLCRFLDGYLRRCLDFSFDSDWDVIDKFCAQAIKLQIQRDLR